VCALRRFVVPAHVDQGGTYLAFEPHIDAGQAIDPAGSEFLHRVFGHPVQDDFEEQKLIVASDRFRRFRHYRALIEVVMATLDGLVHVHRELFGDLHILLGAGIGQMPSDERREIVLE